jgi:hypothetical protein
MLLARLIDAGNAIEAALDWAEDGCEERPLSLEHTRHESAKRHDERGEHREIDGDLNPAVESHGAPLELFGPEERVGEIGEKANRHEAGEPIVEHHDGLLRDDRRRWCSQPQARRTRRRLQA